MISKYSVAPVLVNWYTSKKLPNILYIKQDLYTGYRIAQLLHMALGKKFPLTSFSEDLSSKAARNNWERILFYQTQLRLPLKLTQQNIELIVGKDAQQCERLILEALISVYELDTKTPYPRQTIKAIPRNAVPQVLKSSTKPEQVINLNTINGDNKDDEQAGELVVPPNVPAFCRQSFLNARQLIDHLNQVCINSIKNTPEIADYIEMLDPRADYCYPFPQLLLKLQDQQVCLRVCRMLIEQIDKHVVTECIMNDYSLFYDFCNIILHSVIALNQASGDANELFTPATKKICEVVQQLRSQSSEVVYLIFNNVLISRIFPQLPLVNFSLVHFFEICLEFLDGELNSEYFTLLMNLALKNLRQSQPQISENRLRFEVLIAFTMLGTELGKYQQQLSLQCIRYVLSAELLPDNEKCVALDIMCRCICMHPPVFDRVEFHFFRLLNCLVNRGIVYTVDEEEDGNTVIMFMTRNEKQVRLDFYYDRLAQLGYERVLFIMLACHKIRKAYSGAMAPQHPLEMQSGQAQVSEEADEPEEAKSSNMASFGGLSRGDSLYSLQTQHAEAHCYRNLLLFVEGLTNNLLNNESLPPCHYTIGLASCAVEHYHRIVELSTELTAFAGHITPQSSLDEFVGGFGETLRGLKAISFLLHSFCQIVICDYAKLGLLLCVLGQKPDQVWSPDNCPLPSFVRRGSYLTLCRASAGPQKSDTGAVEDEGKLVSTRPISGAVEIQSQSSSLSGGLFGSEDPTSTVHEDKNLPDYIYGKLHGFQAVIAKPSNADCLSRLAPLLVYYMLTNAGITQTSLKVIFDLLLINQQVVPFVYRYLDDKLFSCLLEDDKGLVNAAIDLIQLVSVCLSTAGQLSIFKQAISDNVQTLLEVCFGVQNKEQRDRFPRRDRIQENCLQFLQVYKREPPNRDLLYELVDKSDYESYGNDQLEKVFQEIIRG